MRGIMVVVVFLISAARLNAQSSTNYLQLFTNMGLNFTLNEPSDVENIQTLSNAITLKVRTQTNCSVYARISSYNVPSGFYIVDSPLQLDWVSDNSSTTGNLVTGAFDLSTFDQRLFTQTKTGGNVYYYNYNLVLQPVGYDYPPGNYNFTLMFTMTQP